MHGVTDGWVGVFFLLFFSRHSVLVTTGEYVKLGLLFSLTSPGPLKTIVQEETQPVLPGWEMVYPACCGLPSSPLPHTPNTSLKSKG